ncbi:FAD-dependent oxidoreductase [Phreatobacter stygius]|uniref:FAD-dependent oxidoreductase n=1 Tax=Phreatobacter stygius TaxID=1940610 RepID=A0A4D7AZX3_9HYPH|nr:FAD-dependent oxidoreductase [Phreatobacter stygius]QCI65941.1 FAD-dependent oxidoreductase [Phreatobacter stygius]
MSPAETYDVVVVGGGSAGIAAAVGAARNGARTLLVERYGFLGGSATNASVLSYCGLFAQGTAIEPVVGGVGAELLDQLGRLGLDRRPIRSASGNLIVMLDPEILKLALDRLVGSSGAELRLHASLVGAATDGRRITGVTIQDHAGPCDIRARAFVDASGEGDLAALTGALVPAEAIAPGRHLQPASYPIRIGGVAPDVAFSKAVMSAAVAAYNATARFPIHRLSGGVGARLPVSGDLWWLVADLETDGVSAASLTAAELQGREMAFGLVEALRAGAPGFDKAHIVSTGPQVGIRQSRRVAARESLSGAAAEQGLTRDDGIGRGGWPVEIHHGPGRIEFRNIGGKGYFDVPFGSLRAGNTDNLWLGGRLIGCDDIAFASVRVMGTAFATGHAAGLAAALQAAGTDDVAVGLLRSALSRQGAIL